MLKYALLQVLQKIFSLGKRTIKVKYLKNNNNNK